MPHSRVGCLNGQDEDENDRDDGDGNNATTMLHTSTPRRTRRSPRWHWPPIIYTALFALVAMLTLPTAIAADLPSFERRILSPRELSKRALPASAADLRSSLARRQSSPAARISEEHRFEVGMSQPKTCAPLDITWDPTKGTPPFTLMVTAELWFQIAIVSIPATYADLTLRRWLYQVDMPSFKNGPTTNQPAIVATIIDSTGMMANTSTFMQVDNSDESCDRAVGTPEFESWTDGAPVQCGPWSFGWNVSGKGFVGPLNNYVLPERQPPILLPSPSEKQLVNSADGSGGYTWNVTVPYGTLLLYTMMDEGNGKSGGVGGRNQVALDQVSRPWAPYHVTTSSLKLTRLSLSRSFAVRRHCLRFQRSNCSAYACRHS